MSETRQRHGRRRGIAASVAGGVACIAAWMTATLPATAAARPWPAPWKAGEGMVVGMGGGLGAQYASMGFKGFVGTDYVIAEVAFGTEPFVWKSTYAVGGSLLLLDPVGLIRPKLTVLLKSNASEVTVYEPRQEGKIQNAVAYEPFMGLAVLAGAEIFPFRGEPGSIEVSVGWRSPFGGMAKVDERANELVDRYSAEHDVATPRLDHLSLAVGLNYRWGGP